MSNNLSHAAYNAAFVQQTNTPEGLTKLSSLGASFTRTRLRETSYFRKLLPPENVTKADCQRSVNHEGLSKVVDIEPNSSAMVLNFRAEPDTRFITADRYELLFRTVSSERFEKDEQELMSYEMPITKVIEQNSVKDVQTIEDFTLTQSARAATFGTQKIIPDADPSKGITSKSNLTDLFDLLDDDHLAVGTILMCKSQLNRYMALPSTDLGDVLTSEVAKDGYKYAQILGHKLVVTIKTDILSPREIFVFTDPDFLGHFYILDNTKFYVDKEFNMIRWQLWETIAAGFGNVRAAARRVYTNGPVPLVLDGLVTTDPLWNDVASLALPTLDEGVTFAK